MAGRGRAACPVVPVVGAVAAGVWASACHGEGTGPAAGPNRTYVRLVNSAFQATDTAGDNNPAGCPCTPLVVDVLFDSSVGAPSVLGMTPNSVGVGSAGPPPAALNAHYTGMAPGVHSFVARAGGATGGAGGGAPTFFTTPSGTTYLPKQYMTGRVYYTFLIAGVNPAQPAGGGVRLAPYTAFATDTSAFPLTTDDPFSPPTTSASGRPVLQARVHLVNAAPFALTGPNGSGVGAYITPAGTPPAFTTALPTVLLGERGAGYVNVTAGSYTLTFTLLDGTVVYQGVLALAAGEVRTIVLQNTLPNGVRAVPAGGVPPAAAAQYFTVTNVLDNKY